MSIVRDLKIDPSTLDLVLENGDLVLVEDLAAISQSVRTRLRFYKGEWFGDLDVGVPWYQTIFLKAPDLNAVRTALRSCVAGTKGIVEVLTFDLTLTPSTRTASVVFSARADTGELLTFDEKFAPTPEVT